MKNEFTPQSQIYWCLQLQSFQTPQLKNSERPGKKMKLNPADEEESHIRH